MYHGTLQEPVASEAPSSDVMNTVTNHHASGMSREYMCRVVQMLIRNQDFWLISLFPIGNPEASIRDVETRIQR